MSLSPQRGPTPPGTPAVSSADGWQLAALPDFSLRAKSTCPGPPGRIWRRAPTSLTSPGAWTLQFPTSEVTSGVPSLCLPKSLVTPSTLLSLSSFHRLKPNCPSLATNTCSPAGPPIPYAPTSHCQIETRPHHTRLARFLCSKNKPGTMSTLSAPPTGPHPAPPHPAALFAQPPLLFSTSFLGLASVLGPP